MKNERYRQSRAEKFDVRCSDWEEDEFEGGRIVLEWTFNGFQWHNTTLTPDEATKIRDRLNEKLKEK